MFAFCEFLPKCKPIFTHTHWANWFSIHLTTFARFSDGFFFLIFRFFFISFLKFAILVAIRLTKVLRGWFDCTTGCIRESISNETEIAYRNKWSMCAHSVTDVAARFYWNFRFFWCVRCCCFYCCWSTTKLNRFWREMAQVSTGLFPRRLNQRVRWLRDWIRIRIQKVFSHLIILRVFNEKCSSIDESTEIMDFDLIWLDVSIQNLQ